MNDVDRLIEAMRLCVRRIEAENARLTAEVNKIGYQNGDLCDELNTLREQVKTRDHLIEELQSMIGRSA